MEKTKSKMVLLPLAALGVLALGAAGALAYRTNVSDRIIDESKLYIGIPQYQDGLPVKLTLSVESNNGSASKEYSSLELDTLEGQDEGLVFLNYAENPLIELGSLNINEWLQKDGNQLIASSTALNLIVSEDVIIDKCGLYLINVASENGATPEVSHTYIYKEIS